MSYSSRKVNDEYWILLYMTCDASCSRQNLKGRNVKTTWRQFIACHRGIQESLCDRVRLTAGIHNCLTRGALHIAAGRENTVEYFPWMHCGGEGGGMNGWPCHHSRWSQMSSSIFFHYLSLEKVWSQSDVVAFQSFYCLQSVTFVRRPVFFIPKTIAVLPVLLRT